jgi:hypothetical protein
MQDYKIGDEVFVQFVGMVTKAELKDGEVVFEITGRNDMYARRVKASYLSPLPLPAVEPDNNPEHERT